MEVLRLWRVERVLLALGDEDEAAARRFRQFSRSFVVMRLERAELLEALKLSG